MTLTYFEQLRNPAFFYDPDTDPINLTGLQEQQQQQQQPQIETVTKDNKNSLVERNDELENNLIEADAKSQPFTSFMYPDDV